MGNQPVKAKQFVVYHIASTMEHKVYKVAGVAKNEAERLNKAAEWERNKELQRLEARLFDARQSKNEVQVQGYQARIAELVVFKPRYAWASREDYENNVVYMVERVNLQSQKKYMEKSNTPGYMSPSRESYWSM